MKDLVMFMEAELRNWLLEYFPNLEFLEEPIKDDNIIGVALINDNGPVWVIVYDEDQIINEVKYHLFNEYEIMNLEIEHINQESLKYYNSNIINLDLGVSTPILMHDYSFDQCAASRFDKMYDSYLMLEDISLIEEALKIIKYKDTMLYVPLDQIDQIINYS
jgi:hypothetical protein